MADEYRLWYVRRGKEVQGPFPEPLLCRYLTTGRLADTDEVSQDGGYWREVRDVPMLIRGAQALLEPGADAVSDPAWADERGRAALRWLDDRKSPDPRRQAPPPDAAIRERRSGRERRQTPETVEQKVYREVRGEFETWLRSRRQRYGAAGAALVLFAALLVTAPALFETVNPVKVGLHFSGSDCTAEPRREVNWAGCVKDGALLVGADLRGAELVGTSLRQANLSYADLRGANLLRAELGGAVLTGARLDGAVWIDGSRCADGALGGCR